jgi:hypothetical protein
LALHGTGDVTGIRRGRRHDHRDGTQSRVGLDLGEHGPAVQAGHPINHAITRMLDWYIQH